MNENSNLYAAPESDLYSDSDNSVDQLAERGDRFIATLIDGLLVGVAMLPLIIVGAMAAVSAAQGGTAENMPEAPLFIAIGLCVIMVLGIFAYQLYLVVTVSATFGKKMMRLYIADMEGNPAGAGKIIGLRMFVNGIFGGIPFVGGIYSLVDILMIFREDRRCLHDLLAGTQVLKRG